MHYLGLCCIVKDEHPFLEEWVAFHTLMGVEAFVIYDNESKIPVTETLHHLLDEKYITVAHVKGRGRQIDCYNHCLREFGGHFAWLGFIDADEFALPVRDGDLRLTLSQYEHLAGIGFNWMPFGSSGHKRRPAGLQIENYTLAMPEWEYMTRHVKLFINPARTFKFINPHVARPKPGHTIADTRGERLTTPFSVPPAWDVCQINHYYYRSNQDFYLKLQRGMADSRRKHPIPEKVDPPPGTTPDMRAAAYAPMVRALLEHASEGCCAALADRVTLPDTPEGVADKLTGMFAALQAQDALVLLAKARRRFPGHPLIDLLARQAGRLEALLHE